MRVAGIDQETAGRREMAFGFYLKAVEPLVGEHLLGGVVPIELNDLVVGGLDGRRFALVHRKLTMKRLARMKIGGEDG